MSESGNLKVDPERVLEEKRNMLLNAPIILRRLREQIKAGRYVLPGPGPGPKPPK